MKHVDFCFLEAIKAAQEDGYQQVAAKLSGERWRVIAIDELLRLQGWPSPVAGAPACGTVHRSLPIGAIPKGHLMQYYKALVKAGGLNP